MSSIRALWLSIAAGACTLALLATPAMANPASPPLVAVGQVLPDTLMTGLNLYHHER